MSRLRAAGRRSAAVLGRSREGIRSSKRARRAGGPIKRFFVKAADDNVTGLSSMVAYNLLLSIFPLALIALFITSQVLQSAELQNSIFDDLTEIFPNAAESTLNSLLNQIRTSTTGIGLLALVASVWICTSFWGALDTSFARIYHTIDKRSWMQQKRFGLLMLLVSLLLIAATVAVPALQGILVHGAVDLPLGLESIKAIVYAGSLAGGIVLLFGLLTIVYKTVPFARVPWYAAWPGALLATVAITAVDYGFPAYLSNVSTFSGLGTTLIFIVIVLIWFYTVSIVILAGAVVNAIRYENGPPAYHGRRGLGLRAGAGAMVQILADPAGSSRSKPGGALASRQVADVVLPREELERIWTPEYLERLARTYWRFLTRVSLGILRVHYTDGGREIVVFARPLRLLTFHAPEYETSAERGVVTWRIRSGLLVAPRGRGHGYLRITAERPPAEADEHARLRSPGPSEEQATVRVSSEVANFYPLLAGWGWFARIGNVIYRETQLRIHIVVTHAFLRSLARLDLAESRVGALLPEETNAAG